MAQNHLRKDLVTYDDLRTNAIPFFCFVSPRKRASPVVAGAMMDTIDPLTQRQDGAAAPRRDGPAMEPFYGPHQSGIETVPQVHTALLAFDLGPDVDRETFVALMRIISDDAARITQGQPPLADPYSSVATNPARLTVTFGYGVSLLRQLGLDTWLPYGCLDVSSNPDRELPWSNADLLVQLSSDDEIALLHGQRAMSRNLRTHMSFRWVQRGFQPAQAPLDSEFNLQPGTREFERAVWAGKRTGAPSWFVDGTTLVVERVHTDGSSLLDDRVVHKAHTSGVSVTYPDERIYCRNYVFEGEPAASTPLDTGVLRLSFQGRLEQFLATRDKQSPPGRCGGHPSVVGTAVFLLPPGCEYGGWVGEQLLDV